MKYLGMPEAAACIIHGADWGDTEDMLQNSSIISPEDQPDLESDPEIAADMARFIEDEAGNDLIQKAINNFEQAKAALTAVILAEMPEGTKVFWTTRHGTQGTRVATGYIDQHVEGREGELVTVRNGKTGRSNTISVSRLAPLQNGGKIA